MLLNVNLILKDDQIIQSDLMFLFLEFILAGLYDQISALMMFDKSDLELHISDSEFQITESQNFLSRIQNSVTAYQSLNHEDDDIKWFDDLLGNDVLFVANDYDAEVDQEWFDNLLKEASMWGISLVIGCPVVPPN